MPYIWAKKFGKLDEQLTFSTSNMFYPAGLTLSRKERLSLIWLAANYDPEKYRKIIPPKRCEEANIESICNAIMNPKVPYALRLSAQLLLGTVRVYRTKTKLILEMAEQMIVKLSSLISETSTRTYDMPVAMLRADAITIADTGMSIIDYSLEPVYYDPQMIMHMNEEDFITVNGSPLQSPIKIEKKGHSKKSIATPTKSPIVVSNSKISFQEDLLSPSKPIQVPTEEEEFGMLGFGPAQDNFLTDLMEIADINLKPKTLDFGPDEEVAPSRLEPVLEDEENVLAVPLADVTKTEASSPQRKDEANLCEEEAMKKVELKDDVELGTQEAISRKRKVEDVEEDTKSINSEAGGEVADLDQLLKEATDVTATLKARADDFHMPSVTGKIEDGQIPTEDVQKAEEVQPLVKEGGQTTDEIPLRSEEIQPPTDEIAPQIEGGCEPEGRREGREEIVDEVAFAVESTACKSLCDSTALPGVPMEWELNLQTPSDAIILKPLPSQPKKKRKLMVDKDMFIESKDMKNNFTSADKLIRVPMIAGTAFPTGRDMFTRPVFTNDLPPLKFWWENNTIHEEGDPIAVRLPEDSNSEFEEEDPLSVGPPSVGPPSVGPPSVGPPDMVDEPMEEELVEKEVPQEEWAPETLATPMEVKISAEAPPKSPEALRTTGPRYDETPQSIDILRGDSSSGLKSFEQSGGSIIAVKETPIGREEASRSMADNININIDDEVLMMAPQASPRISDIGLLPQDAGFDLEEAPELPTVLEQDEKSVDFTADWLEDSDILTEEYKAFQRKIFHSLRTSDQTVFQRLFPSSRTTRRDAALALYLTLNMHKNGYVELQQTDLFGDIYIYKGRVS